MDYTRQQIRNQLEVFIQSTKNFLWLTAVLEAQGLLSGADKKSLLLEKDRITRMKHLYYILLEKPIDLQIFKKCLQNSKNEHLLQHFYTDELNPRINEGNVSRSNLKANPEFISEIERILKIPKEDRYKNNETETSNKLEIRSNSPKVLAGSVKLPSISGDSARRNTSPPPLSKPQLPSQDAVPKISQQQHKIREKPKAPQFTQQQLEAAKQFEGEMPNILFSQIGRSGMFVKFSGLPLTSPCLTTIKLQYVLIDATTFADNLIGCVNLEFLQLDKVKVEGSFSSGRQIILPKLTEYFYNEIRDSQDFSKSLEYIKDIKYDWQRFLFFKKFTGQTWSFEGIWKLKLNIKIQISGRLLLFLDHDRSRLFCHSPSGGKIIRTIFSLDSLSLYEAELVDYNCKCFRNLSELNLCEIKCKMFDRILENCKALYSLTLTKCPYINLCIDKLPIDLKVLSLNIGRLTYGSGVTFQLDTLCLFNTQLDQQLFNNFNQIFSTCRMGLGGDLNGSCLNHPVAQLLKNVLTKQYYEQQLDWLYIWDMTWQELSDTNLELLNIIKLNITESKTTGWLYEYNGTDFKGRSVTKEENKMYIQDLLGFNAFWSSDR